MEQIRKKTDELQNRLKVAIEKIGLVKLQAELDHLRGQMQKPDFWQDSKKAKELSKREATINFRVAPWKEALSSYARFAL